MENYQPFRLRLNFSLFANYYTFRMRHIRVLTKDFANKNLPFLPFLYSFHSYSNNKQEKWSTIKDSSLLSHTPLISHRIPKNNKSLVRVSCIFTTRLNIETYFANKMHYIWISQINTSGETAHCGLQPKIYFIVNFDIKNCKNIFKPKFYFNSFSLTISPFKNTSKYPNCPKNSIKN